jgi:tRNA A37 N6-isopentenylltransferase MiaA
VTLYSRAIYAYKKGSWLWQINTLEAKDANIQQLLMEDLQYQVECLVCTAGTMIYISCIFMNYELVNGKNRNIVKESQAILMTDQGKLRVE